MTKINDILKGNPEDNLPPLQQKVLAELNKRKDEVFTDRDTDLVRMFSAVAPAAVGWTLWALHKKGLISKIRVKGHRRQYFGSHAAVKELARQVKVNGGTTT